MLSQEVRTTPPLKLETNSPKLLPGSVKLRAPVLPAFARRATLTTPTTYESNSETLDTTPPTLNVDRALRKVPDPDRHHNDESDNHVVASQLVCPLEDRSVHVVEPTLDPSMVTLDDPVTPTLPLVRPLTFEVSNEDATLELPIDMPMERIVRKLPCTPPPA